MSDPLVSILIPCFNAERFVSEAIESALEQDYENKEIIVVDDGSTDESLEVIKKYDSHIRWETGPNRGACSARNRAFSLSLGRFIQFLDADDILLPEKISIQSEQLYDNKYDLSFSLWRDRNEERNDESPTESKFPDPSVMDPFLYTVLHTFGTNTALHRREFLERVGGFRLGLPKAQETDLLWRLGAARVRLAKVDKILCVARQHEASRISTKVRVEKDYMLQLFCLNVIEMIIHNQLDTYERRLFAANRLCDLSDIAHRHGLTRSSAMGFGLATRVFEGKISDIYYPKVRWKSLLAQLTGSPWRASEVMRRGRYLRDIFLKSDSDKIMDQAN